VNQKPKEQCRFINPFLTGHSRLTGPLGSCRGFSLIEILVAFTIASTALVIIYQIYSKGVHSALLGKEYTLAVTIAESRLDELGTTLALDTPHHIGSDLDKYNWEIHIEDYPRNDQDLVTGFRLKSVTIDVYWGSDLSQRAITLHSLKPYMSL